MPMGQTTRRNQPCPCGSGRRYKHCCGRRETVQKAIPAWDPATATEVLVAEGFLDADTCRHLVAIARQQPTEQGRVLERTAENPEVIDRPSQQRITTLIKTVAVAGDFCPLVARALRERVLPFYGAAAVDWFEWPDVLQYDPGGHYDVHNDAEVYDPETARWRRAQDRDLSLLIYLNDDFVGGAIEFPDRGQTIQPAAGLLVAFPSDHRFAHTARPVTSGTRYVIVSWAAVSGTVRLSTAPRLGVLYPDRSSIPPSLPVREVPGAGFFVDPAIKPRP